MTSLTAGSFHEGLIHAVNKEGRTKYSGHKDLAQKLIRNITNPKGLVFAASRTRQIHI